MTTTSTKTTTTALRFFIADRSNLSLQTSALTLNLFAPSGFTISLNYPVIGLSQGEGSNQLCMPPTAKIAEYVRVGKA